MLMTDAYGIVPGLTASRETYEAEFRWGSEFLGLFTNALIDGSSVDSGNSPNFELRPGILLGQNLTTGKWKPYSPTASDGTEVAGGILIEMLRMQDFSGNNVDRFYAILVGGPVQASKVLGLDLNARQCMDKFIFDDTFNIPGHHWFPYKRFQTKVLSYTLVGTDNYSQFNNFGAGGAVTLTLPPIANGYFFSFVGMANQNLLVTSNEGANIIWNNTLVANTLALQTAGSIIGGVLKFYVNPNLSPLKWSVEWAGAGPASNVTQT